MPRGKKNSLPTEHISHQPLDCNVKELRICIGSESGQTERVFAAKKWGPDEGEKWIAFHGWLDNAASFDLLAPKLVRLLQPPPQIVCVDLAGHGYSYHRPEGNYSIIDYVADAFFILEALQWTEFCVIGHSLGQSVGCLLAGSIPGRVKKLIMLEGIGCHTDQAVEVPINFVKSLNSEQIPAKPKKVYVSKRQAAERRVEGNAVGVLPLQAAEILVTRGTGAPNADSFPLDQFDLVLEHSVYKVYEQKEEVSEQASHGDEFIWIHDDRVKLISRTKLTEPMLQAFMQRVSCPVLLILAKDGLLNFRQMRPSFITSKPGWLIMYAVFLVLLFLSFVPLLCVRVKPYLNMARMGKNIGTRVSSLKRLTRVILPNGGHHPHLSSKLATVIAAEINAWNSSITLRKR